MLACTYATLILHDDGLELTAENVAKLTEEAGLEVPGFWPKLFVNAIAGSNINELMMNVVATAPGGGAGGGAAPAAAAAPAGGAGKAPGEFRPPRRLCGVTLVRQLVALPRRRNRNLRRRRTWASHCLTNHLPRGIKVIIGIFMILMRIMQGHELFEWAEAD
eukprot:765576-Hanusia_phi.AAC.10